MRQLIYLLLFVVCGCALRNRSALQGVYTCQYQNEFYIVHDTLILKNVNKGIYQIERRTGANQKIKKEKWTLEYDVGKNVLNELQRGRFVVILNGDLIFENRTYKKIKQ